MATRRERVVLETLGIQYGLWCRTCKLSTGASWWHALNGGPLREARQCAECGGKDVEGDPRAEWA